MAAAAAAALGGLGAAAAMWRSHGKIGTAAAVEAVAAAVVAVDRQSDRCIRSRDFRGVCSAMGGVTWIQGPAAPSLLPYAFEQAGQSIELLMSANCA